MSSLQEKTSVLRFPEIYPRDYQMPFIKAMANGCSRAVLVWHRRAGKEMVCWNMMLYRAINDKRTGTYVYFFPSTSLGRRILWDGANKDGKRFMDYIPEVYLDGKPNSQEMKIKLKNGSIIQIIGTDQVINVGINPIGCVFSEYSLQNPRCWDFIRPILRENGGWAVFNFTPRGRNHAYELYNIANKNPRWFCQKLSIDDTKVLNAQDIEEEVQSGMSRDLIQQEFYCSFDVGAVGSYYGAYISEARNQNRICRVPVDTQHLVYTAWDIGIGRSDACAIVFFQCVGNEIRIIDHIEDRGKAVNYYVQEIVARKYTYGKHFLPHDAAHRDYTSGATAQEVCESLGLKVEIVQLTKIEDGIERCRQVLPRCVFDVEKCDYLLKCLLEYRADFVEKNMVYRSKPLHNWASHSADAFRYMAVALQTNNLTTGMSGEDIARMRAKYGYGTPIMGKPNSPLRYRR